METNIIVEKEINLKFKKHTNRFKMGTKSLTKVLQECDKEDILNNETIIKISLENKTSIDNIVRAILLNKLNIDKIDFIALKCSIDIPHKIVLTDTGSVKDKDIEKFKEFESKDLYILAVDPYKDDISYSDIQVIKNNID